MRFDTQGRSARLAKLALAAAALMGGVSAYAQSYTATSPDYIGAANPPATEIVGSFSFSSAVLSLLSSSAISSITVSGVWGGGSYQQGAGNYVTAPTNLTVDGITVGSCGPYDECSSGYNPAYEALEGFSYTFSSAQVSTVLASLESGSATLVANLNSPYSSNYANTLSNLSLTVVAAAVPEPESCALMLAGLGLVGAMTQRRRAGAKRAR